MQVQKIFSLLLFFTVVYDCHAQFTHKIKADSVRIYNDNCNAELIVENSTKDIAGFLFNRGNGRTEFRKAVIKLNDTSFIIGGDTLIVKTKDDFLPLAGGTLTGALTGTSATFALGGIFGSRVGGIPGSRGDLVINQSNASTSLNGGIEIFADGAGNGYGWRTQAAFDGIAGYNYSFQARTNSISWVEKAFISSIGSATFSGSVTASASGFMAGTRAFLRQNSVGDAEFGASSGGVLSLFSQGIETLTFNSSGQAVFTTNLGNGVIIQSGGINATGAAIFTGTSSNYLRVAKSSGTPNYVQINASAGTTSLEIGDINSSLAFITGNSTRYTINANGNNTWSGSGSFGGDISNFAGKNILTVSGVNNDGLIASKSGSNAFRVWLNTNGDSYLTGGNLGIGITTPGEKLTVDGNIRAFGAIKTAQQFQIENSTGGNAGYFIPEYRWLGAGASANVVIGAETSYGFGIYVNGNTKKVLGINPSGDEFRFGINNAISPNGEYRTSEFGGINFLYRNAIDAQINSNTVYNSANQYQASYSSNYGIGALNFTGGALSWFSYAGVVTAGLPYSLSETFRISEYGNIISRGSSALFFNPSSGNHQVTIRNTNRYSILDLNYNDVNSGFKVYYDALEAVAYLDNYYPGTDGNPWSSISFRTIRHGAGTTQTEALYIYGASGKIRINTLNASGNVIVGADNSGILSKITIGSGLLLSGGILSATGGAAGTVTGSGTSGYIPLWNSVSDIGNSVMSQSGGVISTSGAFISASGGVEVREGFLSTYHANSTDGSGYYLVSKTNTTGLTKESIGQFGVLQDGGNQRSGYFFVDLGNSAAPTRVLTINKSGAATFSSSVTANSFSGAGTGLTGTASDLTAGAVTNGVYTTGTQTITGEKIFESEYTYFNTIRATGDVVAAYSSDKRLKNSMKPIENALGMLDKIQGYIYEWNEKQNIYKPGTVDYGIMAQEIEAIMPEIVQNRDNGYKAVKYERLIPLLIQAIKELKHEMESRKN
jgi:hypothetical protein